MELDQFTARRSAEVQLHPFNVFDFELLRFPTLFKFDEGIEGLKACKDRRLDDHREFVLCTGHIFAVPESQSNVQIWIIDQPLRD